jgi:hypothetical protein
MLDFSSLVVVDRPCHDGSTLYLQRDSDGRVFSSFLAQLLERVLSLAILSLRFPIGNKFRWEEHVPLKYHGSGTSTKRSLVSSSACECDGSEKSVKWILTVLAKGIEFLILKIISSKHVTNHCMHLLKYCVSTRILNRSSDFLNPY